MISIDESITVAESPTAITATLHCHNSDGSLWNMVIAITPRSRHRNPMVELYCGDDRYRLDTLDPANAFARERFIKHCGVIPQHHPQVRTLLTRAADEYLGACR